MTQCVSVKYRFRWDDGLSRDVYCSKLKAEYLRRRFPVIGCLDIKTTKADPNKTIFPVRLRKFGIILK